MVPQVRSAEGDRAGGRCRREEIQSWKSRGVDWVSVRAVPQVRSAEGNCAGGRCRRRGDPIVEISRSWEEIEPKRRQTRRTRTAARWRQCTTAPNLSGPLVTSHTPGASPNGKYYVLDRTPIYSEAVKERERIR
ncbi:hypothetical protein PVAP13_1KG272305 [Panicum virgatum]|uniref:Uncharacterized protein n=1 Tax=Panicum virgatum TaxID=38727 RepID=A0A8T0XJ55_PANVG|nr:hypothetical protein PVAP13_1KG272305 [Panicum virgatum]KAG2657977.1 hypothetical protein PVAP13_1KG272305 [Panicum virgatum]